MQQELPLVEAGKVIADRYRLEQRLGDGNFGQVWRATDVRLERQQLGLKNVVAIKFLKEEYVNDPEVRLDFSNEVRALYQLSHHNLLRLFDFDLLPDMAYLVTEFAASGSLAQHLARKGRFSVRETLHYLEQAAAGLDFAHSQKFVHRDLKPHNLLIADKDRLVIADFGLSQISNLSATRSMMKVAPCGTPAYMAPEQWDWLAGWRSDIYALGVIAYQMLTGRLPFRAKEGSPREWRDVHQKEPIPSLQKFNAELPLELDAVIEQALAKVPKARQNSATEMVQQFRQIMAELEQPKNVRPLDLGQAQLSQSDQALFRPPSAPSQPATPGPIPPVSASPARQGVDEPAVLLKVRGPGLAATSLPGIAPNFGPNVGEVKADSGTQDEVNRANVSPMKQLIATRSQGWRSNSNKFLLLGSELKTLEGHQNYVYSVAFSPNSKLLASASLDKSVRLWEVEAGQPLQVLEGHQGSVHSVAFSPSGELVASGSADRTVRLWETTSGRLVKKISGHLNRVYTVALSPNGRYLASASADKTVKLWSTSSWELLHTLVGHTDFVTSLAFSPDSEGLVSASKDHTLRLWDLEEGSELATLEGHDGPVLAVAFNSDGKRLASGSADKSVKLWSLETGQDYKTFRAIGGDYVYSVAFDPHGRLLASASNSVRLRDVGRSIDLESLVGHGDHLVNCVAFSPNGQYLASGADDKLIKIWWAAQLEANL